MSNGIDIEVRDYDESLAQGIADMWNTWDELWPGTFTQGVPYTADRVKKQFGTLNAVAILIAVDKIEQRPVGSCTVFSHIRDHDAAYIGTLGVSPEVLDKKVGKQLLLESIQRALEKGYNRVDLNTWAGNMKAVPLYKKIGMMWNPEMPGVHMEDYIPAILQHPLCKSFFGESADNSGWYDLHVREPIQAPDEYERNGMSIYPYEFRRGNDILSITVDRLGRGITAIERVIEHKKLRVDARVNSHQVLCGLSYNYVIEIENDSHEDLPVTINLSTFQGLVFDEDSSRTQTIRAGDTYVWTVPFHLDSTAPIYRDNIRTPSILAEITINGTKSELHTGLKIKTVADIKTRWGECKIAPGGTGSIPLTIINNINSSVDAKLKLRSLSPEIVVKSKDNIVKLNPEGFGGTILEISAKDSLELGAHEIMVSFEINISNDQQVTTREFQIPIFNTGKQGVAVTKDDSQQRLVIVSSDYTASYSFEGAMLRARDVSQGGSISFVLQSEIGPPFGINPFRFAERTPSVSSNEHETTITMKADHPDRPLIIEDRAIFENGAGIIKHEVWVTNKGNDTQTLQLRLLGRGGGISFARGTTYIPLADGIVKERLGSFYGIYPAVTTNPSDFSEGWIALENKTSTAGEVWDLKSVEEVRLGYGQINMLSFPLVMIEPGEIKRLSEFWFVFGASHWSRIHRLYNNRVEAKHEDDVSSLEEFRLKRIIEFDMDSIVLSNPRKVNSLIRIRKSTLSPMVGTLDITPPIGWSVNIQKNNNESIKEIYDSMKTCELELVENSDIDLVFEPEENIRDAFSVRKGLIEFKTSWNMTEPFYMIQLGQSTSAIHIDKSIDKGLEVYNVSNGLIDFTVSAAYGGCMTSLRNQNKIEFLTSSFPKPTPKPGGFFDNYYGGVQPFVFDDDMGEDLSKAKTNRESMKASIYEHDIWKGIQISWIGKLQRCTRGVEFKLRYMTTPGSPLVLIQWLISNLSGAPVRFYPTIMVDVNLDNQLARSSILTEWEGTDSEVRKGMIPIALTTSKNIVWLKPEDDQTETSGLSFMMAGDTGRMLSANLGNLLLLGVIDGMTWLMPGEERILTGGLLVDPESNDVNQDLHKVLDKL